MAKKTIVIFIGGYLPGQKYGGPVTSLENFSNHLCNYYNIKIICSDHDFKDPVRYKEIAEGWNIVGNAEVYYTNERDYNSKLFLEMIKPFKSEIELFYLSGIYYIQMNYAAIQVAHECGIPVLLVPRGDLMKNAITMKSKAKMVKKLVFLNLCRLTNFFKDVYFQSTSDRETDGLHHYLNVKDDRIYQLPNLPVMKHERNVYQKRKNKLHIVFISRLMVSKNPLYALEAVKNIADKYKVVFDLYGPIEDQDYWSKCNKLIQEINASRPNIHVEYKGSLKPTEAKRVYDSYDCFLFPTVSENYGHVIVESMFADCPVVLSRGTTPWDDYHENGGYVILLNNQDDFTNYLEKIAGMDQFDYNDLILKNRNYVKHKFQVETLRNRYLDMIESIVKKNQDKN